MSVRDNIVKLRKLTRITQQELADIAGVSRGAVSQWEMGISEPRMGAIQSIADRFNIRKSNIIEDGGMDNMLVSLGGRLYEKAETTGNLSAIEEELIKLFRSTDERGRDMVMTMARSQAGDEGQIQSDRRAV